MQSWTVCNPTAPKVPGAAREVRGVGGLAGRTLGLLDNVKPNADHLLLGVAERLRERYGVERVIHLRKPSATHPAPAETLERLAKEADVVLTSTAD